MAAIYANPEPAERDGDGDVIMANFRKSSRLCQFTEHAVEKFL